MGVEVPFTALRDKSFPLLITITDGLTSPPLNVSVWLYGGAGSGWDQDGGGQDKYYSISNIEGSEYEESPETHSHLLGTRSAAEVRIPSSRAPRTVQRRVGAWSVLSGPWWWPCLEPPIQLRNARQIPPPAPPVQSVLHRRRRYQGEASRWEGKSRL